MRAVELAGERLEAVEGERVVLVGPGPAHARPDGRAVALGQVLQDVAFLVANATLHRHGPEHLIDRGPQCLAAVQDDEHAPVSYTHLTLPTTPYV